MCEFMHTLPKMRRKKWFLSAIVRGLHIYIFISICISVWRDFPAYPPKFTPVWKLCLSFAILGPRDLFSNQARMQNVIIFHANICTLSHRECTPVDVDSGGNLTRVLDIDYFPKRSELSPGYRKRFLRIIRWV